MKVIKIFSYLAFFMALAVAQPAAAETNYDTCANLNDYLSYSKCVAEIDSKNNGTPVVLPADLKSQDGAYSLVIDDSSGQTASRYVILNLTASTSTAKIAVAKDSNFGFAARQTFVNKVWWRLEDTPNETQYIYVKFFNEAGDSLAMVGGAVKYVPRAVDKTKETWAKTNFLKLYKRSLDVKKLSDAAWLAIAAYGLNESAAKDEDKEKVALNKFIAIFKRVPAGDDWSLVHASAYSQDLADLAVVRPAASTTDTAVVVTETVVNNDNCQAKQTFKMVMDVGSKGAEVQALQEFFKCLGLVDYEFKVSGTFDKDTEEAGKKFQEQYGLKCSTGVACGRIGPATAKKLNEVSAAAKTAAAAIVEATPASDTAVAAILKLKTNLTLGSKGAEVTALQKFLSLDAEIYPEGKVTGTFGPLTEAAVKRWQTKYELKCKDGTACGYVGAATRQKIEEVSAQ